jgi:hypothetical protein
LKPERNVSVQDTQSRKKYQIVNSLSVNKYVEYGGGWGRGGGESNLEKHCGFLKRKEKVHFPPSRKDEGILSGNLNHNLALNNKLKNIFT